MCNTAQLNFFLIVLDPGVNTKIFSGCAHKKDIYKFHTMGAFRPLYLLLALTLFDTNYHFLPPGFCYTLTIFMVHDVKNPNADTLGRTYDSVYAKKTSYLNRVCS